MHENQRQTIENLERELERDPNKQALILYGSVARGTAGKESDIDLYLVISDDDFDSVLRTGQLTVSFNQMCVEPCTEATGTFIALKNLHEIAQNGKDIKSIN